MLNKLRIFLANLVDNGTWLFAAADTLEPQIFPAFFLGRLLELRVTGLITQTNRKGNYSFESSNDIQPRS